MEKGETGEEREERELTAQLYFQKERCHHRLHRRLLSLEIFSLSVLAQDAAVKEKNVVEE